MPTILKHIFWPDSRKVGFGWWLFIVASYFLKVKSIDAGDWTFCSMFSAALIGGGTVGDTLINAKYGGKNAQPAVAPPSA